MLNFIKKLFLFEKKYLLTFVIYNELGSLIFRDFVSGSGRFTDSEIQKLEDNYLKRVNEQSLKHPYTLAQIINIIKL